MMFWGMIIAFVVLVLLAVAIYYMPTDKDPSPKKPKLKNDKKQEPEKDWKAIAERWERNNNAHIGDIEKLKMQHRDMSKELEAQKQQTKELMDKLSLEKGWREKEQVNADKAKQHEKDLKDQIVRTEKDLEKEHSERVRVERELQEIKIKYDTLAEEKRAASTKAMSLDTTVTQLSREIKDLRRENEELKKKREDIQWVAKSEYDDLKKRFNALNQKSTS